MVRVRVRVKARVEVRIRVQPLGEWSSFPGIAPLRRAAEPDSVLV